jgi:nitrogen fixation/metabolism regulation signal transduction histidine kinase
MKKMVNAFSEYARVPKINLESMDLHEVLQEVLDLYRSNGEYVDIRAQLDAKNSIMEGDAGRIRQLLHNLLKNALEALKETDDPQILIATRVEHRADKDLLALTITDNGPGFDAGILANVFEPYVSTKPRGSGLGLAIVKKIVEEHGGYISAESTEGGGARVVIRFLLSGGRSRTIEEQRNAG